MKSVVYLISFLFLLSACGTATTKKPTPQNPQTHIGLKLDYGAIAKLQQPARSMRALFAAQQAFAAEDVGLATQLVLLVDPTVISRNAKNDTLTVAGQLLAFDEQQQAIRSWLNQYNITALSQSIADLRIQAELALAESSPYAADLWLSLANQGATDEHDTRRIWQALKTLRQSEIQQHALNHDPSSAAAGWLALLNAFQNNGSGFKQAQASINTWQTNWASHSAALHVPDDITLLQTTLDNPKGIAVAVLPLTGKLGHIGEALQAALAAAHSYAPQFESLIFLDQNSFSEPDQITSEINELQADYILGPVDKSTLSTLAHSPLRTAPQIAMNTLTETVQHDHGVIQLSLRIEDEADFVATLHQQGYEHALVLSSQNALAQRASNEYIAQWQQNEEHSTALQTFTDATNFSEEIKQALLLDESYKRLRTIEDIFVERMENNLRRRDDISHIFLSATPAEARAIKPLLPYHFAGDLPVFAPSLIYDGATNSEKNRDIGDIVFVDTPWSVSTSDPIKQHIMQHVRLGGSYSKNLHALAIDSYFIAAYQQKMTPSNDWVFRGRIGDILIHADGTTSRDPIAATINGKHAQAITIE